MPTIRIHFDKGISKLSLIVVVHIKLLCKCVDQLASQVSDKNFTTSSYCRLRSSVTDDLHLSQVPHLPTEQDKDPKVVCQEFFNDGGDSLLPNSAKRRDLSPS